MWLIYLNLNLQAGLTSSSVTSSRFEPAAHCTAGSATSENDSGRDQGVPHRAGDARCVGSDVEIRAPFFLKAACSDCIVSVGDVGIEAAEIAFKFGSVFAQRGHRTRLYYLVKIQPRRRAYF